MYIKNPRKKKDGITPLDHRLCRNHPIPKP